MWTCSKCGEDIEDDFDVCWSCGTSREGIENPNFDVESEGIIEQKVFRARQLEQQDQNFITVATFSTAPEAHMVRSHLEAAGINAYVMDELTAAFWGMPNAPGGVLLQVAEKDAERARSILAEVPRLSPGPEETSEHTQDEENTNEIEEEVYDEEDDDGPLPDERIRR